jgi:hypothetical protein
LARLRAMQSAISVSSVTCAGLSLSQPPPIISVMGGPL